MKISVEIVEDKFLYRYEVGKNTANGEMLLSADNLVLFINILSACNKSYIRKTDDEINEIRCMAYIEAHPELIKKYKEIR